MTPADKPSDPYTVDVEPEAPSAKRRFHRGRRRAGELITDARRTPEQNLRSRERNYMVLQALRIPFILLSMLSAWYWDNWWLASLLFVVSIPLPWVAVMVGNGQGEKRDPRQKNVYKPAVARAEAHEMELDAKRRHALDSRQRDASPGVAIIDHDDE
ncbi:DUF3099 domain-containing protein [Corynebacterium qintianiae]|uniref:DUF3099 domain-containing protein n=1 Tax=Corynebacterium qintianiae TaxID=2709392 RepID=A0A7T0KL96_9CORY|nr:DUF3099 domain-containing protein [Corynebacterium qintianiae]QPK82496.1 DUF3099 domain-containing protein [Corynebacterium qintianiae]